MNTYFCPRCGRGFESKDSPRPLLWPRCPGCPGCPGTPLRVSGEALIVAGLLVMIFSGIVLCHEIHAAGTIAAGAFTGLGAMRLLVARLARAS